MTAQSASAKLKLKENQRNYALSPRGKWSQQKAQAKARGVPFTLTFEAWNAIWQDSGKYAQRGKALGQYCMARNNDAGGYEVGNVSIQKVSANMLTQLASEAHISVKLTHTDIATIQKKCFSGESQASVAAQFGISQPHVSRLTTGKRGTILQGAK